MIADWLTNKIYFSEKLKSYPEIKHQIEEALSSFGVECQYLDGTNDIWARDYMPVQVSDNKFIEYRYDPDYLQGIGKDRRPIKTYPDIVCSKINLKTIKSDIILDGGNIVKSTNCIILTDKIFKENRFRYNMDLLMQELKRIFEVDKVVVIPWDKNEFCGHSDGMVRFIDNDTILLQGYYDSYDSKFKQKLYDAFVDHGLKVQTFKVDVDNEYSWAYLNYMQTKDVILLPSFGNKEEDNQALIQIKELFPTYAKLNRIRQIEMLDIIRDGGAMNCISWTIKV